MKSSHPLQTTSTQTFIPLAVNHCGRRGPHFNAILNQFASLVVSRPRGCRLPREPSAQTSTSAMGTILTRWGARITWVVQQREFSAQPSSTLYTEAELSFREYRFYNPQGTILSGSTMKHSFRKRNIYFRKTQLNSRHETRVTRQEDIRHDSVCDVMRFRIFTEISD